MTQRCGGRARDRKPPAWIVVARLLAVMFLTTLALRAQTETGSLAGKVIDPSGNAVPSAKVTLSSDSKEVDRAASGPDGRFSFEALTPGTYTVRAEQSGYAESSLDSVQVNRGERVVVKLQLRPLSSPQAPGSSESPSASPSFYDPTQLKPGSVQGSPDAAGYSSQALSPGQLLRAGPSLKESKAPAGNSPAAANSGGVDPVLVERELKRALQLKPDSFEANHNLGEFYLSVGSLERGIPYLEKAQQLNPADYTNGYDLALAYVETRNFAPARSEIEDLIKRQETAELHNLLAEVEEATGNFVAAANEYQRAAHMDPSEGNIFDWGSELLLHETSEPAIEVFTHGVERYPRSAKLQIGLGIALYSRGYYDRAIDALCSAADLEPSDSRPYLFLGKMYNISTAKSTEVAKRLDRFVQLQPGNAMAHYYYAMSLWKGKREQDRRAKMEQIESFLRRALALDPQYADAHLQLGILYADAKRYPEAIAEYQQAIKLQPALTEAHYRLAQSFMRVGEKTRAQEEFDLYNNLHKQQQAEKERQRMEIKQFVYSIKEAAKP